jgi:hypothetical protein
MSGHNSKLILIENNWLIHAVCILVLFEQNQNNLVPKKYEIISKIMFFAKIYPGTKIYILQRDVLKKINFHGNDFLLRIHSSMFFLFPLAESHFENP